MTHPQRASAILSLVLSLSLLVGGCAQVQSWVQPTRPTQEAILETLVTFQVTLPAPLQPGESVVLAVLDEVTGLGFNQQLTPLQAEDALHYEATLRLRLGTVLKYRYLRQGAYTAQEHLPNGSAVRYRLHYVGAQATVPDQVSRWTNTPYTGETGRILGTVTDRQTGAPIPGLLVTAGGMQTFTQANGAYLLEGLAPGEHNLVIYAQDGAYQTFEQGAEVSAGASTPADVGLEPALFVEVTFNVSLPESTSPEMPLRLAGNLRQLGNTFTDLSGGISTLAARMPTLTTLPDGRRTLTLSLPVGADIRYKYTLGDGIWNAEYDSAGSFGLRQLIVPAHAVSLDEQVFAWAPTGPAPVVFQVLPPALLPSGDNLSIQFNPGYGWLEPLPMTRRADGAWSFTLFSPLQGLKNIQYRYCRNEQCGSADDAATAGPIAAGRALELSYEPQVITDAIEGWAWLPERPGAAPVPDVNIPRRESFLAGIAFQAGYHPAWLPHLAQAVRSLRQMNADWVILSPTWRFAANGSALLAPDPAQDMPYHDALSAARQAQEAGLNVGMYPQLHFPGSAGDYWQSAPLDYPAWVAWFAMYRAYALHHARLANDAGAGLLILGGRVLLPAVPSAAGTGEASPAGLPADAETWWRELVAAVRAEYGGALALALPFPEGFEALPPFMDLFDLVYVEWSAPLAAEATATETELAAQAGALMDAALVPFIRQYQLPVVLALSYPSAAGALSGCIQAQEGACLDAALLARPNPDVPSVRLALEEQTMAYNAIFLAVNERPWIGGVVSAGFYPPAMLQDKSASVYAKPAAGALWYWFDQFLRK